jgi:hypothetical protein
MNYGAMTVALVASLAVLVGIWMVSVLRRRRGRKARNGRAEILFFSVYGGSKTRAEAVPSTQQRDQL